MLHRPQDARLAEFIAETGLRKGEALGLALGQVDAAPLEVSRQLLPDCTTGPLKNRRARRVGLSLRARELTARATFLAARGVDGSGQGSPNRTRISFGPVGVSGPMQPRHLGSGLSASGRTG